MNREAAKASDDLVKCSRCGSTGDTFVLCSGCHTPIEVTNLRVQLAAAEASNRRQVEFFDNEKAEITGKLFDAFGQLETAKKALEPFARLSEHVDSQLHKYSGESQWDVTLDCLREAERVYDAL